MQFAIFQNLEEAVRTAQQIIQYGIPIARIEMLNKDQMDISINYSKLKDLKVLPTLFLNFMDQGHQTKSMLKWLKKFQKIIREALLSGQKISRKK